MRLRDWTILGVFLITSLQVLFCFQSHATISHISGSFFSIYGEDDRKDLYEFKKDSRYAKLADSTVALFKADQIISRQEMDWLGISWFFEDPTQLILIGTLLKDKTIKRMVPVRRTISPYLPDNRTPNPEFGTVLMGRLFGFDLTPMEEKFFPICDGERFADQPTGAFCSGSLIAPNLVLTAGHCIDTVEECEQTRFVFGYDVKEKDKSVLSVSADEVYQCKKIHYRDVTSKDFMGEDEPDFAIIELDRSVSNHQPLLLNQAQKETLTEGSDLFVIGHPIGLPTKVSANARVIENSSKNYFRTNLDTYGGNSGSPVFSEKTGLIEGVLVAGTPDFEIDKKNKCFRSVRYKDKDKTQTEIVTRGSVILEILEDLVAWKTRNDSLDM